MATDFDLHGHRGARGLFPENSLAGFVGALALGLRSLELDVVLTRDGVPVVTHDVALAVDRTREPDGAWLEPPAPRVRELTLAELRRFDIGRARPGSDHARKFPAQIGRDGEMVPTLAEVLALTATSGARLHVELKTTPCDEDADSSPDELAAAVVAALGNVGAMARAVVRSFDWRGLLGLARAWPELPLAWLTDAETAADFRWWAGYRARDYGGSVPATVAAASRAAGLPGTRPVWAPDHAGLRLDEVAEAHALGLAVMPWTVNDAATMSRLIAWGVDGLCTDRPDLALALIGSAG